eukprot:954897-Pelagomonas_calceolata.AAC.4
MINCTRYAATLTNTYQGPELGVVMQSRSWADGWTSSRRGQRLQLGLMLAPEALTSGQHQRRQHECLRLQLHAFLRAWIASACTPEHFASACTLQHLASACTPEHLASACTLMHLVHVLLCT